MMPMFDPMFWVIVGPAFLLAIWAQAKVSTTFARYSRVAARSGMSGAEAARAILHASGLDVEIGGAGWGRVERGAVRIEAIGGRLSDHYDPRTRTLRLSEGVYAGRSLAALGVAAHEAGHAIQHAMGYAPMALRTAFVPIAMLGSQAAMPLLIIGMLLGGLRGFPLGGALMTAGIIAFAAAVAFQVITLPVELNASRRAVALLTSQGIVSADEAVHARKVLTAAALTYVAAALQGVLTLVYYLALFSRRR